MQKLKPFFPPLDQVQSLNLRAALLRSLENAKKNGILGRDAVLRKTMLDECKGERLLDLLSVFSSAVLKKVVVDDNAGRHQALALKLAVENRGYKESKAELSTLVLAHKVSLHKAREKKQVVHARFQDFSDLLGVKERGLVRKREEIRAREQEGKGKTVSESARQEMRRTVRNNWTGDERWMETVLTGDVGPTQDGPFGMPFDRVWRRVQQDRLGELEAKNAGLLEQLDGRVRMHKERLEKWRSYRRDLFGDPANAAPSPSKKAAPRATRGIELGFGAHEDIRIGRMNPKTQPSISGPKISREYRGFLDGLKKELDESSKPRPNTLSWLQGRRRKAQSSLSVPAEQEDQGAISELSDLEEDETDNFTTGAPISSFSNKISGLKRLPARPNLARPDSTSSDPWGSPSKSSTGTDRTLREQGSPSPTHQASPVHSPSPHRRAQITTPGQSPTRRLDDEQPQPSPTQQLADQILASMNEASPSPSKRSKPRHTLSLAERTRLSMAPRASSIFLDDDEPELESTPTAPSNTDNITPPAIPINESIQEEHEDETLMSEAPEDLISRTRRSMAGFEKAKQKAQLERRRSQRRSKLPPQRKGSSYFPTLDEEDQDGQGVALTEEMMKEEDMEAVFRSRPKIVASPLPSPTREVEFEY